MKLKISILFILLFNSILPQIKNYRVSPAWLTDPNEVAIAINPNDPSKIAAAANISYFFFSSDSGKTWKMDGVTSPFGVWGDPNLIFDEEGVLYFAHLSNPNKSIYPNGYWIDRIVVQKSKNYGLTWNDGAGIGFNSPKQQDKEWMAYDYKSQKYKGNLYIAWTEFDSYGSDKSHDSTRILFSRSLDKGLTWSYPVKVSDKSGNCIDSDETVEGAVPAVGPNGEVYISWAGPHGLLFDKSLDGGKTFGKDIFVTDIPGGWDFNIPGIYRANGLPVTACDVADNSPYKGNIYINWSDQRNGKYNTDIFFVKSTDGGNTWSEPLKVNTDNTNRHQFFTWMTVDKITGVIYIIFYDRRSNSGRYTSVYLARSDDGGNTFTNHKISQYDFEPSDKVFFGDYTNIDAYNGVIHPIWMRADGEIMSIWTAKINDKDLVTSVEDEVVSPASFKLYQNYPNPFNPETTIGFELEENSEVELSVFNQLGQKITTLAKGRLKMGFHEVNFDASGLSSGVYIYRLKTEKGILTKKMSLMK